MKTEDLGKINKKYIKPMVPDEYDRTAEEFIKSRLLRWYINTSQAKVYDYHFELDKEDLDDMVGWQEWISSEEYKFIIVNLKVHWKLKLHRIKRFMKKVYNIERPIWDHNYYGVGDRPLFAENKIKSTDRSYVSKKHSKIKESTTSKLAVLESGVWQLVGRRHWRGNNHYSTYNSLANAQNALFNKLAKNKKNKKKSEELTIRGPNNLFYLPTGEVFDSKTGDILDNWISSEEIQKIINKKIERLKKHSKKQNQLVKESILLEYKPRFDPNLDHTLWISPEGKIWSLKDQDIHQFTGHPKEVEQWMTDYDIDSFEQPAVTHGTWMAYNWEKLFGVPFVKNKTDPYEDPLELGWIRIRNESYQFNIQGKHESARKLFRIWWPTVAEKMKDFHRSGGRDSLMVYIDYTAHDKRETLSFRLPRDKNKLINWAHSKQELKPSIEESTYVDDIIEKNPRKQLANIIKSESAMSRSAKRFMMRKVKRADKEAVIRTIKYYEVSKNRTHPRGWVPSHTISVMNDILDRGIPNFKDPLDEDKKNYWQFWNDSEGKVFNYSSKKEALKALLDYKVLNLYKTIYIIGQKNKEQGEPRVINPDVKSYVVSSSGNIQYSINGLVYSKGRPLSKWMNDSDRIERAFNRDDDRILDPGEDQINAWKWGNYYKKLLSKVHKRKTELNLKEEKLNPKGEITSSDIQFITPDVFGIMYFLDGIPIAWLTRDHDQINNDLSAHRIYTVKKTNTGVWHPDQPVTDISFLLPVDSDLDDTEEMNKPIRKIIKKLISLRQKSLSEGWWLKTGLYYKEFLDKKSALNALKKEIVRNSIPNSPATANAYVTDERENYFSNGEILPVNTNALGNPLGKWLRPKQLKRLLETFPDKKWKLITFDNRSKEKWFDKKNNAIKAFREIVVSYYKDHDLAEIPLSMIGPLGYVTNGEEVYYADGTIWSAGRLGSDYLGRWLRLKQLKRLLDKRNVVKENKDRNEWALFKVPAGRGAAPEQIKSYATKKEALRDFYQFIFSGPRPNWRYYHYVASPDRKILYYPSGDILIYDASLNNEPVIIGNWVKQDKLLSRDMKKRKGHSSDSITEGLPTGGNCYEANARYIIDSDLEEKYTLVHGIVTGQDGPLGGKQFGHCWLEYTQNAFGHSIGFVLDKSNGKNINIPLDLYYKLGQINPKQQHRYTAHQVRIMLVKNENWGPWETNVSPELHESIDYKYKNLIDGIQLMIRGNVRSFFYGRPGDAGMASYDPENVDIMQWRRKYITWNDFKASDTYKSMVNAAISYAAIADRKVKPHRLENLIKKEFIKIVSGIRESTIISEQTDYGLPDDAKYMVRSSVYNYYALNMLRYDNYSDWKDYINSDRYSELVSKLIALQPGLKPHRIKKFAKKIYTRINSELFETKKNNNKITKYHKIKNILSKGGKLLVNVDYHRAYIWYSLLGYSNTLRGVEREKLEVDYKIAKEFLQDTKTYSIDKFTTKMSKDIYVVTNKKAMKIFYGITVESKKFTNNYVSENKDEAEEYNIHGKITKSSQRQFSGPDIDIVTYSMDNIPFADVLIQNHMATIFEISPHKTSNITQKIIYHSGAIFSKPFYFQDDKELDKKVYKLRKQLIRARIKRAKENKIRLKKYFPIMMDEGHSDDSKFKKIISGGIEMTDHGDTIYFMLDKLPLAVAYKVLPGYAVKPESSYSLHAVERYTRMPAGQRLRRAGEQPDEENYYYNWHNQYMLVDRKDLEKIVFKRRKQLLRIRDENLPFGQNKYLNVRESDSQSKELIIPKLAENKKNKIYVNWDVRSIHLPAARNIKNSFGKVVGEFYIKLNDSSKWEITISDIRHNVIIKKELYIDPNIRAEGQIEHIIQKYYKRLRSANSKYLEESKGQKLFINWESTIKDESEYKESPAYGDILKTVSRYITDNSGNIVGKHVYEISKDTRDQGGGYRSYGILKDKHNNVVIKRELIQGFFDRIYAGNWIQKYYKKLRSANSKITDNINEESDSNHEKEKWQLMGNYAGSNDKIFDNKKEALRALKNIVFKEMIDAENYIYTDIRGVDIAWKTMLQNIGMNYRVVHYFKSLRDWDVVYYGNGVSVSKSTDPMPADHWLHLNHYSNERIGRILKNFKKKMAYHELKK